MRLSRAVNLEDMRRIAKRRLPTVAFDAIDGAAGDEITMRRNREGFDRLTFRPRPFVDITKRSTRTTVFGQEISMPVMLAPTGAGRLVHRQGELAVARAAGAAETVYMQSTVTGFPLEEVAKAASGPLWFQLYLPHTRTQTEETIARVAAAGYTALALTIDTPIVGNRERDKRNRIAIPARITPKLIYEGLSRPGWSVEFLRSNLSLKGFGAKKGKPERLSATATQDAIVDAQWPVTWNDVEFIRKLWNGPLLIKGVMRSDECGRMIDSGVDGFIVSNHGGRQLDGLPASIELLPEVIDAVAGRRQVFLDGGVRRGEDVVKAIALGAAAVFIGRPYIFGLAAGGQHGVTRVLEMLRAELDRTMALLGLCEIADIDASLIGPPRTVDRRAENS